MMLKSKSWLETGNVAGLTDNTNTLLANIIFIIYTSNRNRSKKRVSGKVFLACFTASANKFYIHRHLYLIHVERR
jgi:hypothetical protein